MDLKICRICGGIKHLKAISDQDSQMIKKLLICANVNIHPEDMLPKLICVQCDQNLDLSYRLRKQSEATQKRLRIEIQKKQKYSSVSVEEVNTPNRESVEYHSDFENINNPQSSEDSFGTKKTEVSFKKKYKKHVKKNKNNYVFEKADKINQDNLTCEHKTIDPQLAVKGKLEQQNKLVSNDLDHEGNKDISYTHNDFLNNKSDDSCDNTRILKAITEVPIVSEYCSIDLVSSSESSINDYDDKKKDQIKATLTDADVSVFTCDTCHEIFTEKQEYKIHIKQHGIERYQCIQCCKFFPSRFRLKRHEEIHNEIPSHQCFYCNRNYRALYNLKRHIRSAHSGKKSWECSICNISFSRIDVLKRHLQLHSDEKNYKCSMCSQSFKTKDYLCAHHKAHHAPNSKLSNTYKRIKKDNANKNQCGYCGKLFKSSFTYKNHLLIHTNEKPYKCDSCNKHFRTIAALTTHQRIHDDYRPYQCDLCLKSFRQTSHLKDHKLLHLDNVPKHICSICQAPFSKKNNLKTHLRIHKKEKPFKCADCSAEFSYMHLLQRHASKVHYRSVHKVYTLSDVNETIESDGEFKSNNTLNAEMYHYIDTVADEEHEYDNDSNVVDILDTSSPELEVVAKPQEDQQIFNDKNFVAPDNKPIVDHPNIHSQPPDEDFVDELIDDEHHMNDQKVDLLVTEETKLTSSIYNVYKLE